MMKFIKILLVFVLTSLYYFPFEFVAFRGVNTKMGMAAFAVVLVVMDFIQKSSIPLQRTWMKSILSAVAVSLVALLSTVINQTQDNSYVVYIFSYFTWLGGAYTLCRCMHMTHGKLSIELIVTYLSAVCLMQCISAYAVELYPGFRMFVDNHIVFGQDVSRKVKRMYGLGSTLDIAGVRFSCVLTAQGYLLGNWISSPNYPAWKTRFHLVSFLVVSIIGNMIARTTTVGMVLGLCLFFLCYGRRTMSLVGGSMRGIVDTLMLASLTVLVSLSLYEASPQFRRLIEFGFEGFFSLAEQGKWETGSNTTLLSMIVFPETLHTWVIGDGYFVNQSDNPYFLGKDQGGFYMGTDIGYLRFIFYFGLIGLFAMASVMHSAYAVCSSAFPEERPLFLFVFVCGLIIWLKVSTDVFLFYAPFMAANVINELKNPATSPPCESPTP